MASSATDAPKSESLREDRATIGGEAPGTAESATPGAQPASMDATRADSLREDRATIDGSAPTAAGPLSPERAARAASKNPARLSQHGLRPADFGTNAAPDSVALAQAIAAFQQRHGLAVDGVAGANTAGAVRELDAHEAEEPGGATNDVAVAAMDARGSGSSLLQMKQSATEPSEIDVHRAAAEGVGSGGQTLPHLDRIQASFGAHDLTGIEAHVGGPAATAADAIGAEAYATGSHVAFGQSPDLHTAAHEAAHVVQQRAGVHLKGGVGETGDVYERQADAVADAVVRGESAEHLLGEGQSASTALQRKPRGREPSNPTAREEDPRLGALDHVAEWKSAAAAALDAHANYLNENWSEYLKHTAGNPSISAGSLPDASILRALAQNAFSSSLTAAGAKGVAKIRQRTVDNATKGVAKRVVGNAGGGATGALVGAPAGPIGAALGFVIGVLVETAAGMLFDWIVGDAEMRKALEEAYNQGFAQGGEQTGTQIETKRQEISVSTLRAKSELDRLDREQRAAIANSSDEQAAVLGAAALAAQKQAAAAALSSSLRGLDFAYKLLELWARDHAGSSDHADGDTTQAQWTRVTNKLAEKGDKMRFAPGVLMNQPDLFIVQTAHHWESLGVPHAQSLRDQLQAELNLPEGPMRSAPYASGVEASKAAKRFSGKQFVWEQGIRSAQFSKGLPHADGAPLSYVSCTMTLGVERSCCIVKEWSYVMRTESGQMLNAQRSPQGTGWTHVTHGPLSETAQGAAFPVWEQERILTGISRLRARGLAIVEESDPNPWLDRLGQDRAPTVVIAGQNDPVRIFRVVGAMPPDIGDVERLLRNDLGEHRPQRVGSDFVLRGGNVVLVVPRGASR